MDINSVARPLRLLSGILPQDSRLSYDPAGNFVILIPGGESGYSGSLRLTVSPDCFTIVSSAIIAGQTNFGPKDQFTDVQSVCDRLFPTSPVSFNKNTGRMFWSYSQTGSAVEATLINESTSEPATILPDPETTQPADLVTQYQTLMGKLGNAAAFLEPTRIFWERYQPGTSDLAMAIGFAPDITSWRLRVNPTDTTSLVEIQTAANNEYRLRLQTDREILPNGKVRRNGHLAIALVREIPPDLRSIPENLQDAYLHQAFTLFGNITGRETLRTPFATNTGIVPAIRDNQVELHLFGNDGDYFSDRVQDTNLIRDTNSVINNLDRTNELVDSEWQSFLNFLEGYEAEAPVIANTALWSIRSLPGLEETRLKHNTDGSWQVAFVINNHTATVLFPPVKSGEAQTAVASIRYTLPERPETPGITSDEILNEAWDQFVVATGLNPEITRLPDGVMILTPGSTNRKSKKTGEPVVLLTTTVATGEGSFPVTASDILPETTSMGSRMSEWIKRLSQTVRQLDESWDGFRKFYGAFVPGAPVNANILRMTEVLGKLQPLSHDDEHWQEGLVLPTGEQLIISLGRNPETPGCFWAILQEKPVTRDDNQEPPDLNGILSQYARLFGRQLPRGIRLEWQPYGDNRLELISSGAISPVKPGKLYSNRDAIAGKIIGDAEQIATLWPELVAFLDSSISDAPLYVNAASFALKQEKIPHQIFFDEESEAWYAVLTNNGQTELQLRLTPQTVTAALVALLPEELGTGNDQESAEDRLWRAINQFQSDHAGTTDPFRLGSWQLFPRPENGMVVAPVGSASEHAGLGALARLSFQPFTEYRPEIAFREGDLSSVQNTMAELIKLHREANAVFGQFRSQIPGYLRLWENMSEHNPNAWITDVIHLLEENGHHPQIVATGLDPEPETGSMRHSWGIIPDFPRSQIALIAQSNERNTQLRVGLIVPTNNKAETRKLISEIATAVNLNALPVPFIFETRETGLFIGLAAGDKELRAWHRDYSTPQLVQAAVRQIVEILPKLPHGK